MSGMELNKIAAAIILAGLIGMVTSKVTDMLYVTDAVAEGAHHGEEHAEVKRGYTIEVADAGHAGDAGPKKPTGAPDITAILAASADVAAGQAFFDKRCATCHTAGKGEANKIGPNLYGVHNRAKASLGDFKYSSAMTEKGGSWTYENLNQFLYKPKKWLKGTIMAYAGISKDRDRADVIAYLHTLSDNPAPLPAAPAPAAEEEATEEAAE